MSKATNLMDGKRVKIESKSTSSVGVDRISQLADRIIVDILSRLWFNTAATTSILSKRWYDLWRHVPLLSFTPIHKSSTAKLVESVNSIVEKHKAQSLKSFTISCKLDRSSHSAITKWLEFAFSKRVEVMYLSFDHGAHKDKAVVLREFLPSNLLQASNLRSLTLGSLKASGEAIELILRDCRLLERLVINTAVFTSDIEVCDGPTATGRLALKHLEIACCSGGKWVEVSAMNLACLKVFGSGDVLLWVENVPNLVEVNFCGSPPHDIHESCFISQLQILTISISDPLDYLKKDVPTMPKLMELNVRRYHGRSKYLLPTITSLMRASPLLQTLDVKFWEYHHEEEEEEEEDMEVAKVEAFEHHNLRLLKFSGFDVEANMELVSFILDNCAALGKLILQVYKNLSYLSPYPDLETRRAMREADMEKTKQLLQPRLPTNAHLQIAILNN